MLSKRGYFTILMLIVTIFLMFMLVGVTSNIKSTSSDDFTNIKYNNTVSEVFLNIDNLDYEVNISKEILDNKPLVAIIANKEYNINVFKEFCIYNKYLYKIYDYFPAEDEIRDFDLMIFGDMDFASHFTELEAYSNLAKTMFFTKLPSFKELSANDELTRFFGIDKRIDEEILVDGFKIFPDFMINNGRTYVDDDYFGKENDTNIILPYYSLLPGYEIYSVGLFNNQKDLAIKDLELPPILWKTKTNNSFVFVINSDIFTKSSLLGILTAFKSKERSYHIYPIVNGQTISIINYPYLSNENDSIIKSTYGRSSQALSRDILWPNIVQILNNYGESSNFFFSYKLDYNNESVVSKDDLNFYMRQINKLSGDSGLSLSQQSENDILDLVNSNNNFYKDSIDDYKFSSLYMGDFSNEDLSKVKDNDLLKEISLVLSDYDYNDYLLSYIDDNTLSIKYNLDGFSHETTDDLRMISIENALGMCNMKVDLSRVFYPESYLDEWNNLSVDWSSGKTYFNDFGAFDFISIKELEKRVKRFLQLDYIYEYNNDSFDLHIENFDEEAYFIFSIYDKDIREIINGEIKKINKDTYLVKANSDKLSIKLEDKNFLNKPKYGINALIGG